MLCYLRQRRRAFSCPATDSHASVEQLTSSIPFPHQDAQIVALQHGVPLSSPNNKVLINTPSRGVQLLNNHGHPNAGYPHCTTNKITCMDRLITRMQVICLHHTYPAEHTVIGESIPLAAAGMAFQACVQHMPLMACNTVSLSSRLVIPNQRNCDTQTLLHYYHSRRSQTEACRTSSHHHTDAEIPRRSTYMVIQPSNSPSSNGRTHTVVEWS